MTIADQHKKWLQFSIFQQGMEKRWRPSVLKAMKDQMRQFRQAVATYGGPGAVSGIDHFVTQEGVQVVLGQMHRDAGMKWGYTTWRELNQVKRRNEGIVSYLLDFIENYFNQHILNLAKQITDYTKEIIRERLQDGLDAGKSYEQIANDLVSDDINKVRAERIVRTETVRAANLGSIAGAKKTGLQLKKIWISAKDNRTRRIPRDSADHLHLDTQMIDIDGKFVVPTKKHGDVLMSQPGDPSAPGECTVNCRCTMGFESVRDDRGRLVRQSYPTAA